MDPDLNDLDLPGKMFMILIPAKNNYWLWKYYTVSTKADTKALTEQQPAINRNPSETGFLLLFI